MDTLERRLEAFAPGPPEDDSRQATGIAWTDPDDVPRRPRWILMLGADADAEPAD